MATASVSLYELLRRSKLPLLEQSVEAIFKKSIDNISPSLHFKSLVRVFVNFVIKMPHPMDNSCLKILVFDFLCIFQNGDIQRSPSISIYRGHPDDMNIMIERMANLDLIIFYSVYMPETFKSRCDFYGIWKRLKDFPTLPPLFFVGTKTNYKFDGFLNDLRSLWKSKNSKIHILEI